MYEPFLMDFTPDAPYLEGGSAGVIFGGPKNVINLGRSFAPFKAYAAVTSASGVGDFAIGLFSFRASNGTYYTFGGIDDALKLVNGTSWDDVTRTSGGAYTGVYGTNRWNFIAYGNRVIATNYADAVQTYLAGTDTDFSALAGSPPKAKYIDVSGDFVVLGYVNDGTVYPFRVQWSAQGDPTASWASSATTQADYQDMNSNYGVVTGVSGHDNGFYVFQERAITPFYYVGSPLVFTRGETITGIGCVVPSSLAKAGGNVFFVASDGIKMLRGNTVAHIGLGRVDSAYWFNNTLSGTTELTTFADPVYPVVHIMHPAAGGGLYLLTYNYVTDKWTFVQLAASVHCMGVVYNSSFPLGTVAGFLNSDKKLGTFSGTAYAGTFCTRVILASENGGKGGIGRVRVRSEIAAPTSVTLRRIIDEFLGSDNNTTMTAVGNNNQFTIRAAEAIAYQVHATINEWSALYKLHGIDVLEGTTGNPR